jgi:hypothetical protein
MVVRPRDVHATRRDRLSVLRKPHLQFALTLKNLRELAVVVRSHVDDDQDRPLKGGG